VSRPGHDLAVCPELVREPIAERLDPRVVAAGDDQDREARIGDDGEVARYRYSWVVSREAPAEGM
jgi:hypothetical protein